MADRSYISQTWFVSGLIGFIIFDTIALAVYAFPILNWILLPVVIVALAWYAWRYPRVMVLLPLAELAWGSFGAGMMWEIGSIRITLRMLMFAVFIAVWIIHIVFSKRAQMAMSLSNGLWFVLLLIVVAWGFVQGFIRLHPVEDVFFDGNAYLFLLYLPVWLSVGGREEISRIASLLLAAGLALSVKTLLLVHVFSAQYEWLNVPYLYVWIRDTRIGELTQVTGSVWRIFMQSQLYIVIALLWCVVYLFSARSHQHAVKIIALISFLFAAIIVSLSRSFWLGIALSVLVLVLYSARSVFRNVRYVVQRVMQLVICTVIAAALILIAAPSFITILPGVWQGRVADVRREPASVSRLQLLPPLLSSISTSYLAGYGFGARITYTSSDPRIKTPSNPQGLVTTYALEWGYLEQIFKFGAIAFAVYIVAVVSLFFRGLKLMRAHAINRFPMQALLIGLFCIMVIHIVSPYLNHPLGLGYLMLTASVLHWTT